MRLWSLNPKYLDSKGLGAVWREGLLAQAVLLGKTKGWKNHSHLLRFKYHEKPIHAIGFYLLRIYEEANTRGYRYRKVKIVQRSQNVNPINVTKGQLLYEFHSLKERLKTRALNKYKEILKIERTEHLPQPHPLFRVIDGDVESWEKTFWRRKHKA
jgi:hypothetical protein